jgi:hypothetical protein
MALCHSQGGASSVRPTMAKKVNFTATYAILASGHKELGTPLDSV